MLGGWEKNARFISVDSFFEIVGCYCCNFSCCRIRLQIKLKQKRKRFKIEGIKGSPTICPYCSLGCGILVYVNEEKNDVVFTGETLITLLTKGSLCSKGTSIRQLYL
ncbi:hypothetical protein KHA80_15435 [Anaerobacillus sp. HL2]|nr:hypothetical protein KHA80_15435 [Anaerobacillus sp. HL2]